jgi:serine/threonine protein kinase
MNESALQALSDSSDAGNSSDDGNTVMRDRLAALVRGDCSEEDFVRGSLARGKSTQDSAWDVLSFIDQQYRRGRLSVEIFRSIESKIARHALKVVDHGQTVDLDSNVLPAVDAALPAVTMDTPTWCGRTIGHRFILESVLGSGGMGTVFKAIDKHRGDLPESKRYVAIKVLHRRISEHPEMFAALKREFYCAQSVAHQNIVSVYDVDRDGDIAFFSMELLEGEPLSAVIDRAGTVPLDPSYAWAIVREIGCGLTHAHSRNVVHGDLKPQNVMITERGEVRILDFGASGSPHRRNCFPSVTPAYASCELLEGEQADPRDDLYALSCLTIELLGAEHPFQKRRSIEARDMAMSPRRPPGLTNGQWHSLQHGLAWRREQRPDSVRAWAANLALDLTADRLPPPHSGVALKTKQWDRIFSQRRTGIAVLSIGLAAAVAFVLGSNEMKTHSDPVMPQARPVDAETVSPSPTGPPLVDRANAWDRTSFPATVATTSAALLQSPAAVQPQPAAAPQDSRRHDSARGPTVVAPAARAINTISATGLKVRSGQRFAEISVRRSDTDAGTGFAWWTVDSTATGGADFVPQTRTTQYFSNGKHWTRLFVRLLPNPSRKHPEIFYVAIARPDADGAAATLARVAIWVPPHS